jgi:pyrroloquinoline quinone (PQQ) biosynthesis protein C
VLSGFDGTRAANGNQMIIGDIAVRALGETAESDYAGPQLCTIDEFPDAMTAMLEGHRPSRMPFFERLAAMPHWAASDPSFLGQIHLIYQSAMHATRAAVYYLPHLDSPALRKRKLQIFVDDDGLADGDTHHYQLTRAFRKIGAKCVLEDEEFGDPTVLCRHLDGETARFVTLASRLYSRSLGPWCAIETMSVDWMRALAEALSVHFPQFKHEPYFEECFSHKVEERHASEALEVTQLVLRARPALLVATMRDAKTIARALDGVWSQLDRITQRAAATRKARRGALRRSGSVKAATAPLP